VAKSTDDLIRELEAGGVIGAGGAAPPATQPSSVPAPRARISSSRSVLIVVAAILVALVGSLPFGSLALYPFALLVTLIHETSHALAGVTSGGSVVALRLNSDLSGVTNIAGGVQAVIAPAGYLGATLAGVAMLLTPPRFARHGLAGLALFPLSVLAFFHPANAFTAVWSIGFAAALAAAAWKLPQRLAAFLLILLGLEAGLNAFRDLLTLLLITGSGAHMHTDAVAMSDALFFPPIVWSVLWTVIATAMLVLTVASVVRRDLRAFRSPPGT
jgi:hypothetical protein